MPLCSTPPWCPTLVYKVKTDLPTFVFASQPSRQPRHQAPTSQDQSQPTQPAQPAHPATQPSQPTLGGECFFTRAQQKMVGLPCHSAVCVHATLLLLLLSKTRVSKFRTATIIKKGIVMQSGAQVFTTPQLYLHFDVCLVHL